MASTTPIPRRPVQRPTGPAKASSVKSASSSIYSESPGFARSFSNSSKETKDSLSGVDSEAGSGPPPVPPKAPRPQPPQTPKNDHVQEIPSPISKFQASPPRGPEIWRRRSVKSDRSLSITELKLVESNGATVHPPQQPLPQRPLPAAPSQAPRGLPGRKPVPLRPAPPQPDLMGSKASKLKSKLKNASEDSRSHEAPSQPLPPIPRLGTPDHLKSDLQQSLAPQILSSLSPNQIYNPATPAIPPKSESRRENAPAAGSVPERPNFLAAHSREPSNETLTISSDPAVKRSPQPRQPFAARILTPQPSPSTASEKASPVNPANPSHLPPPAPEGTIFLGPELSVVHFECYQSHRLMRGSKNTVCPVACMVCKKKDTEMRFRCAWCCLSACGPCTKSLSSIPGKDLRACLKQIGA
jgi:hypothetical protein